MLPKDFTVEGGNSTSRYTLQNIVVDQKTKIRVLSDFITGKSIWLADGENRKPFRLAPSQTVPVSIMDQVAINKFTGQPEKWRQFIAAVVWNYTTKQVEILETDKSPLIEQIFDLESDDDWGDSKTYDLGITKTGSGKDTRWSAVPSNKAAFKCPEDWKDKVNLTALYEGENPFAYDLPPKAEKTEAEIVADDIPF